MIATRERKRRLNLRKLLLPVVAIAALGFALFWPPSQRAISGFIVNGPLAPVWRIVGAVVTPLVGPLHFAAQEQVIADRNKQVEILNGQLEEQRKAVASRDQQITNLQNQVKAAQAAAAQAAATTPAPVLSKSTPANAGSGAGAPPAVSASDDPKRTAAVWSAMEPEQAAAIARKLPAAYTAKVLGLMSPDTAGALLGALPPDYAARVSQGGTR